MYFCNDCFTEIPDSEIGFNENANVDFCPYCQSRDVEYSGEDESTETDTEDDVPPLEDLESFMNKDDEPLSNDIHETDYDGDRD